MPLRIEEIDDLDRLRAIRPAWEALWHRDRDATPFSSPAWLLPWCEHLGGTTPWAIAAWRGAMLTALAPTFVYQDARGRVLGLLGGGVSDDQDVLADGSAAVESILRHLARRRDRFDVADLQSVPLRSKLLVATARCGLHTRVGPEGPGAVASWDGGRAADPDRAGRQETPRLEEFLSSASPRLLQDVRYQRRRLAREGGLTVARVTRAAEIGAALEDLFRLHGARWASRGREGVLAAERIRRFHLSAAAQLFELGALRLFTLHAGGQALGACYGMTAHGRALLYLFGTDPQRARCSPGSLIVAQAIEDAIGEGASELDFLRGEEAYKARWGAVRRVRARLQFRPVLPGLSGRGRSLFRERDVGQRACPPRSS